MIPPLHVNHERLWPNPLRRHRPGVAGGLLQVKTFRKSSAWTLGSSATNRVEAAPFDGTASITPSATNSIEYIAIPTQGDAVDFGDLTVASYGSGGICNAHGGL